MGETGSVLVTGSSSGFGLLIVRTLLRNGYAVIATMRGVEGKNAEVARELSGFAQDTPGRLHVLDMDVTSEDQVDNGVRRSLELVGRLDVAVNNAGIASGGYAEGYTIEQWKQIFDINVFGVQRVNRAVLPSMREHGAGLLIHISSVMGRIVIPFSAPYTATKWALEGMLESYRYELARTGVDVVSVEPGGFKTGLAERLLDAADQARVASYGELADVPERMWGGFTELLENDGPDPQLVADAVLRLIETPAGERPLRTVVDPLTGGEGANTLNETSDRIQAALLGEFGLGDSLAVKK